MFRWLKLCWDQFQNWADYKHPYVGCCLIPFGVMVLVLVAVSLVMR